MTDAGYRELHRSADAANYAADDVRLGRVDMLFARRPYSLAMLARAPLHHLPSEHTVKIMEPEDLIGLKVQAS